MMLAAMLVVAMIAVAPALAQDDPAVIADATTNKAGAGGAQAEAECKDGVIEAKAGGVVAKAPCETPPPPPPPPPLLRRPPRRLSSCRRLVAHRCSRSVPASCWWPVGSWPAGSSARSDKRFLRGRGGAVRHRPFRRSELLPQAPGRLLLPGALPTSQLQTALREPGTSCCRSC